MSEPKNQALIDAEKALERSTKLTSYSADGVSIVRPAASDVHVQVNRLRREAQHEDAARRGARQPTVRVASFSDS